MTEGDLTEFREREPAGLTATFVFADIAGFTALTEAHGDEQAESSVSAVRAGVR